MIDNDGMLVEASGGLGYTLDIENCTFAGNRNPGEPLIQITDAIFFAQPFEVSQSIFAFNDVALPLAIDDPTFFEFRCSDVFGNSGGDYVGALAARLGVDGNISADPLFCALELGDVFLQEGSPAVAECGLMGSHPVGCEVSGVGEAPTAAAAPSVWPSPTRGAVQAVWSLESGDIAGEPRGALVVDAQGRTVRELGLRREEGRALVAWDGRDGGGREVPTGVYWIRVVGSVLPAARVLTLR